MLNIHQPYKYHKQKYCFALFSVGALLLICLFVANNSGVNTEVYAAGDSRTLSDISTMQEMSQQICSNSEYLETSTLKDTRDTNSYSVIKLEDENCWMQQNLKLVGTAIDSNNSDIASGSFYVPISSLTDFGYAMNANDGNKGHVYYDSNNSVAYYNWYTATAGTDTNSLTGSNAETSICAKGWQLPSKTEYENMLSQAGISNDESGAFKITGSRYNFSTTGYVMQGSLFDSSKNEYSGYFWSSTTGADNNAYNLYVLSPYVGANDYVGVSTSFRYAGLPVRCMTKGGLPKIEKPIWLEDKTSNISVNVPSTLTIDAASGMAENADSSKITEGTATATVSSNTDYTVTLHSSQPTLKDPAVTTAAISPVSNDNPVVPGNNSWGFWSNKTNADGSKIYDTPITTEPQEFYNTTTSSVTDNGNTTTHTYYVGISIAPSLPSGTYSTDVIITAATK